MAVLTTSLHTSQVAHAAGPYPGFRSMKRLGVLLLLHDGILVHRRLSHNILSGFPDSLLVLDHLYSWVERTQHGDLARTQTQTF